MKLTIAEGTWVILTSFKSITDSVVFSAPERPRGVTVMCWVALAVVPWGGTRDLCFDEISLFETLPPSQSLRNIGLPLKRNMMWKMAIGWWRLIQKKHEQWSIWQLVRWRETLIGVSSATWWILGGKRSTGNARHVIYDGSVTPRVMLLR